MRLALAIAALCSFIVSATAQPEPLPVDQAMVMAERPPALLSQYRFFTDARADAPNNRVTPYELNTALWSDGALKYRYLYLPPGAQARYREQGVFDFPVGAVLIKTFGFAADMRQTYTNIRFMETRLLIHRPAGWIALAYVWNDAQTEARLSPIGATVPIDFISEAGAPTHLDWEVPNRNQCKGCHDRAGEIVPIGPSARNLNGVAVRELWEDDTFIVEHGYDLASWRTAGILSGLPEDLRSIPRAPNAYTETGSLHDRARTYLDVNCAHCHNPEGPAHTSGLDLHWSAAEPVQWGVLKRPVAAGRASANMEFSIAPGDPDHSILLHRMESLDPGVMMPELGRQTIDPRGVALIREWIGAMGPDGRPRATD